MAVNGTQKSLGKLEAQVSGLEARVLALESKIDTLLEKFAELTGGKKAVLALAGTMGSAITMIVGLAIYWFKG